MMDADWLIDAYANLCLVFLVISRTPVEWVSIGFQVGLGFVQLFVGKVRPELTHNVIGYGITVASLLGTFVGVALYPGATVDPVVVTAGLVLFALVPPVFGLFEARFRRNGQAVYSTGKVPETLNRFPGHLLTNVLGASSAAGMVWLAHSIPGFEAFLGRFNSEAAFNVLLPLSAFVAFAFARSQQVEQCPDLDERVKRNEPDWEEQIVGSSLRHWHQLFNTLYLIAVTFTVTTGVLYFFAYAMDQSKANTPLPLSWQSIVAILVSLGFFYACGLPTSRMHKTVYLTFLTGTPIALGAALIWLTWFRESTARNVWAASIVGVGYVLYCVEAVYASRGRGEKIQLHYFASTVIAIILVALLGALYYS